MTTQRQDFTQRGEADLQKELAAAERRLSQHVMRYEMIEGYLQALSDIGKKEKGKKKVIAAMYRRAPKREYDSEDEKLRLRKREAMRARGLSQGGSFDQVAQSYAQISCLYLTTEMQARLPRELRDFIYNYIWDEDYLGLTPGYISRVTGGTSIPWSIHHPHAPDDRSARPIVIDPAYVDPDTAREALEVYYRASAHRKDFFLVRNFGRLHTLLHDDVFNLGIRPAEHLRAIDIHLRQEEFQILEEFEGQLRETINEAGLSRQLARLFNSILRKKDFKLHITIIQRKIRLNQWDILFRILVPFYHAFREEGAEVHVSWGFTETRLWPERTFGELDLDDIVKVWTPYFWWKEEVVRWLVWQSDLRGATHDYEHEDDTKGFFPSNDEDTEMEEDSD